MPGGRGGGRSAPKTKVRSFKKKSNASTSSQRKGKKSKRGGKLKRTKKTDTKHGRPKQRSPQQQANRDLFKKNLRQREKEHEQRVEQIKNNPDPRLTQAQRDKQIAALESAYQQQQLREIQAYRQRKYALQVFDRQYGAPLLFPAYGYAAYGGMAVGQIPAGVYPNAGAIPGVSPIPGSNAGYVNTMGDSSPGVTDEPKVKASPFTPEDVQQLATTGMMSTPIVSLQRVSGAPIQPFLDTRDKWLAERDPTRKQELLMSLFKLAEQIDLRFHTYAASWVKIMRYRPVGWSTEYARTIADNLSEEEMLHISQLKREQITEYLSQLSPDVVNNALKSAQPVSALIEASLDDHLFRFSMIPAEQRISLVFPETKTRGKRIEFNGAANIGVYTYYAHPEHPTQFVSQSGGEIQSGDTNDTVEWHAGHKVRGIEMRDIAASRYVEFLARHAEFVRLLRQTNIDEIQAVVFKQIYQREGEAFMSVFSRDTTDLYVPLDAHTIEQTLQPGSLDATEIRRLANTAEDLLSLVGIIYQLLAPYFLADNRPDLP